MRLSVTGLFLFLFLSSNFAQSWVAQSSGVTSPLRHIYFYNSLDGWAVGANGVYLKTTNGGVNWQKKTIANGDLLIGCWMYKETIGWIGGDNGVYYTSDAGANWTQQSGPYLITKLWFFDAMNGWAVGGSTSTHYGIMYKTTNGGASWSTAYNSSEISRLYGIQWYNQNIGWAYDETGNFLKTTDGGANWVRPSLGGTYTIHSMKFIDQYTGYLSVHLNTDGYLLKTTDGGNTWTGQSNPLTYIFFDMSFSSGSNGWAAGGNPTFTGFYQTTDGGNSWSLIQTTGVTGWENIFMKNDAAGWAVSENGDIYAFNGVSDVSDNESGLPSSLIVEQNYPNPFNPTTNISFSLPYESIVKVEVYNSAGELISSLYNGEKSSGSHELNFKAVNLSSGVYLYRVSAVSLDGKHSYQISKKMTILK